MRGVKPGWRATFLGPWLALVVVGCALFAGALGARFLSDDFTLVRAVAEHGPFAVWSGAHSHAPQFFRPLTSLSFFVDHAIYGYRAWGFHLTNVVLHAGNAWLVGRIAVALFGDRRALATTSALLFLAWPAHGEPVAWISGRTDVLAATFGLGSFVCYLHAVASGRRSWAGLALLLFALGLGAKESLLALPLVVLAHQAIVVGELRGRSARLAGAFVAVWAPYALVRRLAVGAWIGGYGTAVHLQHDGRFLRENGARQVAHALGFGVPDYGSPAAIVATFALGLTLAAAVVALAADRTHRRAPSLRLPAFLAVAGALSLLPSLNLAVASAGTEGERYLYFATAWLALLVAAAIAPALERPRRLALAGALVAAAATLLVVRNRRWPAAGQLGRQLVATLAAQPTDRPLVILDLPDDLRDAYVLRNSVWDALALVEPSPPPLYVVGNLRLDAVDEPAAIERRGQQLRLTLPDSARGLEYWTLAGTVDPPFTVVVQEPRRLEIALSQPVRVLAFVHGALVPVE